jgi:hypothetical protein
VRRARRLLVELARRLGELEEYSLALTWTFATVAMASPGFVAVLLLVRCRCRH